MVRVCLLFYSENYRKFIGGNEYEKENDEMCYVRNVWIRLQNFIVSRMNMGMKVISELLVSPSSSRLCS